jgi:predicted transposase YbfD/YdcC
MSLKGAYDKGEKLAQNDGLGLCGRPQADARHGRGQGPQRGRCRLEVLGLIDLKGKIVTGDALYCNRRTVATIIGKGGDYCIARATRSLLSDARSCLAAADKPSTGPSTGPKAGKKPPPTVKTETMAHGRIETRIGVVVEAKGLAEHHDFQGLKAFGRVTATRTIDGKTSTDVRIFALSRKLSPEKLLETARAHWQIENALHWQLDVSFGEDAQRNRKDNGPANIAVLRRRALDVARLDQSKGLQRRRAG